MIDEKVETYTDRNGKHWNIWKQKSSGFNKWAVCPVGEDHTHPLADAAPTKKQALGLIDWTAQNKEQ